MLPAVYIFSLSLFMAILPKCTPLFLYIGVGFAYIDRQRLETISSLMLGNAASILLDMIFRLPA